MAYVNDMQSLADIAGGAAAAQQAGIQNDAANQQQQIANTTAQGQQAAEIAKPGLANMYTQAQTANENAVAQQNQTSALVGQATAPGKIGALNAEQSASMTASQAKSVGQIGQIAGQVAGIMDGIPAFQRPDAMQKVAQSYGIDPDKLGPLMNGDPDMLRQVSQKAVQASASYQEQQLKGTQDFQRAVTTTGQLVSGRQDVADTSADARTKAAQIAADARTQNIQNVIGQLTKKVAEGTATPQEQVALKYANDTLQLQKSGNPFAATLTGTQVQSNTPTVPGNTPDAARDPQPIPSTPAAQQAITTKFQAYEPDKYNYVQAINPKTGQMDIGRVPK
jgi:hypothetical protein